MTNPGHTTTAGGDWRDLAACRDHDPSMWFPEWSLFGSKTRGPIDAWSYSPDAADICATCPAAEPCLAYALHRNVDGIWAATTPIERRQLRRRYRIHLVADPDPFTTTEEPAA